MSADSKQSLEEFPRWIYALLFVALWGLLLATVVVLYQRRASLSLWKLYLYAGLFAAYLLAERRAHQAPQAAGRRAHEGLRYLLSLAWWALMIGAPLEYGLWPKEQLAVTIAGGLLVAAGTGLRVWSVRTLKTYFSGHIEAFEGQPVVEAGPYGAIRHPAYAGNMLQVIGMPLVVNAYGALVLSALVIGLFVRRLLWEEEFLVRELDGYAEYMKRTKRLIPGVW